MDVPTERKEAPRHPPADRRQLRLYRYATLAGGLFYLAWWVLVQALLPGAFNPLGSRLVVVVFCLALFAASFFSQALARNMATAFFAATWAVTLHYFYLFSQNASDINWVVGTYILVIAVGACTSSLRQLAAYGALVLALSALLIYWHPALLRTIFLSGLVTIFVFAWLGLRARLRLVTLSREAAERLQHLFDAVFEGIVLHDHGIIIDANESFAELFGYRRAELPGMNLEALTALESRALVAKRVEEDSPETYVASGLRRDGTTIPLELAGKRHLLEGRQVRLTAVRDLTERKQAERNLMLYEAAEESLRARDEFLLSVSHELKTPITHLKLQTQLASREAARAVVPDSGAERVMRYFEQADEQISRLAILIDEVVDIARIGTGELRMAPQRLEIGELSRRVVSSLSAAARRAGCELQVESPTPVFLLADPARLEQALANLLTNALKYGAGHPVAISVRTRGRDVLLAVQDQGMGISKEDQERIFGRFERAVSARHISGLGLGLFVCKYIVEAHGGRIEVASEPGRGARFTMILPGENGILHAS